MKSTPMKIALLGAGLTRNWGGWLATELVGELCGRIKDLETLHRLKVQRNFELVLADLRQAANRGMDEARRFAELEAAVLAAFGEMNSVLATRRFEINARDPSHWLVNFFGEFDAIFTLNQDLLLELHYVPGKTDHAHRRWRTTTYPGLQVPPDWDDYLPHARLPIVLTESAESLSEADTQPIYKLHGSVNWRTSGGSPLLVIGGSKDATIKGSTLLSGYLNEFDRCLHAEQTKLMVIGYSFQDEHINSVIQSASDRAGLQTYLVNPAGLSIFDSPPAALIATPKEVFKSLRLAGVLTRPFRDAFAEDHLAFNSIWRFLRP